jgi:hypothetical protein
MENQFGKFDYDVLKYFSLALCKWIRGQSSTIFVFSTCRQNLSSQYYALDIENPLGGSILAKLRSSL